MGLTKRVIYAVTTAALLLAIGTFFFHTYEGWSYVDSFYFATMTLTTIGYGDFVPTTDFTKLFTSIYSILGIGVMLYLVTSVIGEYLRKRGHVIRLVSGVNLLRKHLKRRKKR